MTDPKQLAREIRRKYSPKINTFLAAEDLEADVTAALERVRVEALERAAGIAEEMAQTYVDDGETDKGVACSMCMLAIREGR